MSLVVNSWPLGNLVKLYAPRKHTLILKWNIPWNIPRNIPWNIPWNMKISKMEYSKINLQQGNIEIFGIWNIPGIFQKKPSTREILKFLEYGI